MINEIDQLFNVTSDPRGMAIVKKLLYTFLCFKTNKPKSVLKFNKVRIAILIKRKNNYLPPSWSGQNLTARPKPGHDEKGCVDF